ncbi:hypothetical protein VNO77_03102 [Canavalia gladiata]|uniref:Uncharacterized protein n=1 Tax=Canavalia gladiata TaxID=3824 RepID=A0AAN9R6M3_CANGL
MGSTIPSQVLDSFSMYKNSLQGEETLIVMEDISMYGDTLLTMVHAWGYGTVSHKIRTNRALEIIGANADNRNMAAKLLTVALPESLQDIPMK